MNIKPIGWEQIGGLEDVKLKLKQVTVNLFKSIDYYRLIFCVFMMNAYYTEAALVS
jgi:SpoVK/Ycf46/Vps4 family AAA+-type ATPase